MRDREAVPGTGLERSEESGRSSSDADTTEESDAYTRRRRSQEEQAQANRFEREEAWRQITHDIRVKVVHQFARIGQAFIWVAAGIIGWLILIVLIHFTIPQLGWLNADALSRLGNLYSNSAQFFAPIALVTNAWLVAYISLRHWRSRDSDDNSNGGRS